MNFDDEDEDAPSDIFDTQSCMTCQTTRIVEAREPGNRESYLRMALIELFFHFFFLVIIIYISDSHNNKLLYDVNNSINSLFFESSISDESKFVNFNNISTPNQAWEYMENHMLSSIFWELEYGGRNLTDEEIGYVLYKNKFKYFVQLRQIRTKSVSCKIRNRPYDCYRSYGSKESVYTSPIRLQNEDIQYKSYNDLGYLMYMGRVALYRPEGHTIKLRNTKAKAIAQLRELKTQNWIDRSTRAVFVEFVLYNNELVCFCYVRIVFEFPVTGGCLTSSSVLNIRVFQYESKNVDVLSIIMHLLFMFYIIYYLFLLILELFEFKLSYFTSLASYIDITIVVVSMTGLGLYFYSLFSTVHYGENNISSKDAIFFGYLLNHIFTGMSVVFCLSFVKLFKYLNFNATLWSLSKTIYLCSREVFCLLILSAEIYIAFALLGFNLFGYEVEEFSTVMFSLGSMVRVMLGDFSFKAYNTRIDFATFLFALSFQTAMFFIFFALFLAIVLTSYQQVGLLHQKQKFEMQMLEFTYRKMAQLFRKKYNEPPLISVKEWAKTMMDLGHPADAAQIIIGKYKSQGIDKDSYLTYPQQDELTYELEYYIKSEYMQEKAKLMYIGFHKLKNLYDMKANPFPKTHSTIREISIITRMLNDLKDAATKSDDIKKKTIVKILFELDKRRNLLLPQNTPMK